VSERDPFQPPGGRPSTIAANGPRHDLNPHDLQGEDAEREPEHQDALEARAEGLVAVVRPVAPSSGAS
jgi:hypothetical protein